MALYYNLVFGLLVSEMVFFGILSLPFPRRVRRQVLRTVLAPFENEKFQIALKCVLGFVFVLFVDSVNRVYAVTAELRLSKEGITGTVAGSTAGILNDRSEVQARRFYAQRNMYLCGFSLFLTLILIRTYGLVAELLVTKDKLDNMRGTAKLNDSTELKELKKMLADQDKELELLREKASYLLSDYDSELKNRK
ncbi:uncharacterized protein KQ657_002211 [Scheffersomyces spartinae]|uniref:Endoplasmic reticulum transmembrane protein n=1 Tax=Scheffersomyces spartinae TaxID=45513 RepID=A0A9P8AKF0_9ASCO|nr:uncharacterized protein KQ657_002211 [Scheffersomyces spartinae]KAG7195826.1 hypothetical protein KQ657_002211 [Scheffersomyces spartinae]